jgi:hypothetical protein
MAEEQNEYGLPLGKDDKRRSDKLLPRYFRTEPNKKFLQATIDQLTQSGTVRRLNGFIGRQNSKAVTSNDVFLEEPTVDRQNYQLEPALVSKDELGNINYFKDYIDYINTVNVLGGDIANHQRLNSQEMYSWDPHINWDKFVNFQQYYWMPYGPPTIKIFGQSQDIVSTYTVRLSNEGDNQAYLFTPDGLTRTPAIRLYRGQTYRFDIDTPDEPFSIKTQRQSGPLFRYTNNVSAFAVEQGVIEFTVPEDAPDVLYYVSENNADNGGLWQIFDIDENSFIDVEKEIIGKKTYRLASGLELSNGMKISFGGNVTPASYAIGAFYVEGVGEEIVLISEKTLEVSSSYSESFEILFDDAGFDSEPFSDASVFAAKKDYITINRKNTDKNPWSRYNRWFHQDVIIKSYQELGQTPVLDQDQRANRPIIEFESNLKLHNFGTVGKDDVDLVDIYTKDVFSIIEGSTGYKIDGIDLAEGQRILFLADPDSLVKNKIFKVKFLETRPGQATIRRQIHLEPVQDSSPQLYETVIIKNGVEFQSKMFWFNGTVWKLCQEKTDVNQPPLFDLFDSENVSLSDTTKYEGSTFSGNEIFSYEIGNGVNDPVLGFPLAYKNINNVGDIVFNFKLSTDNFRYKIGAEVINESTNNKYLKKILNRESSNLINGWTKNVVTNVQPIIRIYKGSEQTKEFAIDVFDDINNLLDLEIKAYVNGKRINSSAYSIENRAVYKYLVLNKSINNTDILTIKAYAKQPKNINGYYEVPNNFQNNPLNSDVLSFTLGQVIDHVDSIVDNLTTRFVGEFPGSGNMRDIAELSTYGTKFVQHSGPVNVSLYHLTSKNSNVIKALEKARDDYGKFKRNFVNLTKTTQSVGTTIKESVDQILFEINKDKPKLSPYYFSDTLAYGAAITSNITVVDSRIKSYPIAESFSLSVLSNKAVNVYINDIQIIYEKDYIFNDNGFVEIFKDIDTGDVITIYEYDSTDGCYVPPTPSSLGIWPKFEPKKYLDTTLITPRNVIQGHDGSVILAYDDYRDDLILELEKRIFNNIKVSYDTNIFDIYDHIPGYNRITDYSIDEFNRVLSPNFYQWTALIDRDFTKPLSLDLDNAFNYNYSNNFSPDNISLPGYWRGIYKWAFDTDRPQLCPWEMLGFSVEPSWWVEVYGPAPYTKNNSILWEDLKTGTIRQPGKPVVSDIKFARPILEKVIPVDEHGNLIDPIQSGIAQGFINVQVENDFVFGDQSPVETAWRRSSYYPFSVISAFCLLAPAKTISVLLDRSRIVRNSCDQLIYNDTGLRIRLEDIKTPSIASNEARVMTSGLINYVVDYIVSDVLRSLDEYRYDLKNLTNQLSHRIGGFTSKEKFNLILDSKTPTANAGVFVPQENYKVFLNTGSPVKKLVYSGVIVTKILTRYGSGFEIKGYSQKQPFFYYYQWTQTDRPINVGGISESFINWDSNQRYVVGNIISYNNAFYRVKLTHTTDNIFREENYQRIPSLPIVGGRDAFLRKTWERVPKVLNYGTTFYTVQDVVDFLQGYGEYLKDQGFVFDDYNTDLKEIASWETAVKEFMFWTTQNWSTGAQKYKDWSQNTEFKIEEVVLYNGDYYRVKNTHVTGSIFDSALYVKLDGLNQDGASVIALSPSALGLSMNLQYTVVDDLRDSFNEYEIFRADGQKFDQNFLNYTRENNSFSFSPRVDGIGIYGAVFYLVQKEHVIIIDNTTQFNDTIYDLSAGYRQERIKVSGYKTINWYGGFDVPGFIFDSAKIQEWQRWVDYNLGDIVKYKEFYYSASKFLPGTLEFNNSDWIRLDEKPESELLPNWDYKAEQFTDFYDLDSDNFDSEQQRMAQHLIGYQKRQYLENIIKNDVSEFKFYQGMISEKGSSNSLTKLFDVLSAADRESIDFNEEWAIKLGQYGASDAFEEIEIVLNETEFKTNPQAFELVTTIDNNLVDFVIRQRPSDIYVTPSGYNNNPWPELEYFLPYLRTPGHVRYDQVAETYAIIDDILDSDVTRFSEGDYIWVAYQGRSWTVYRYTLAEFAVRDVEYKNGTLTLQFNSLHTLNVGDIFAITNSETIQGFHKVITSGLTSVTVSVNVPNWQSPFQDSSQILIYKLTSQNFNSINDVTLPKKLKKDELIWIGDYAENEASVWKNSPVYQYKKINNLLLAGNEQFGKSIALNQSGQFMAVSDGIQTITVYEKTGSLNNWVKRQEIAKPLLIETQPTFAETLSMSSDANWLAVGIPSMSNIPTKYVGVYDNRESTVYQPGEIVKSGNTHWVALNAVSGDGSSITLNSNNWAPANLIEYDSTGFTNSNLNQGLVLLYKKDDNGDYILTKLIVSPDPVPPGLAGPDIVNHPAYKEQFGSKVKFARTDSGYTMAISSIGYNANQGRIYFFRLDDVDQEWKMDYDRRYRGIYDSSLLYAENEIVFYDFTLYQAKTDTIGNDPSQIVFWKKVSDKNVYGFFPQVVSSGLDTNYNPLKDDSSVYDSLGNIVNQLSETAESVYSGDYFGYDFDFADNGRKLVISAPSADRFVPVNFKGAYTSGKAYKFAETVLYSGKYYSCIQDHTTPAQIPDVSSLFWTEISVGLDSDYGKVFVYHKDDDSYDLVQTLGKNTISFDEQERFGESVSFSADGKYLAVGSTLADGIKVDQGIVRIFENQSTSFTLYQTVRNRSPETAESFGQKVFLRDNAKTLVIFSQYGDSTLTTGFDNGTTTFDNGSLRVADRLINAGRVDVYNRYESDFIYSESLTVESTSQDLYGNNVQAADNVVIVSAENAVNNPFRTGAVYSYEKVPNTFSWQKIQQESNKVDISKIKKVFLYNRKTSQLITYLDVIDPQQGRITGIAEQEIKYKTYYDPATYSVGATDVVVDDGMAWLDTQVGTLWWDIRNARFLDSYFGDVVYKNNTWNTLHRFGSIDVYEWVSSRLRPSEWDAQADTEAGLAQGISGTSLYGDRVYSVKKRYDSISKSFRNTYYFWVKNKTTVPNVPNRNISANDVARLIEDPKAQGIRYISFTSTSSFSLANVQNLLNDKDIVLSVQYWTVDPSNLKVHTDWKIISENLQTTVPSLIEEKWFDSLVGVDKNNRPVPDIALSPKKKYGILFRPRQSMFVNRLEAVKQFIERLNFELKSVLITDSADLTKLFDKEPIPSKISSLYDVIIDTEAELRLINTGGYRPASVSLEIDDGKIKNIIINEAGSGFVNAPYLTINGTGTGAVVKTIIDPVTGSITGAEILSQGVGYSEISTTASIRDFSVLVLSDEPSLGRWAIYTFDISTNTWSRNKIQGYDVSNFWNYIDWYSAGYSEFTKVDYLVDNTFELYNLPSSVGQTVRVKNIGSSGWILLEKYADVQTLDYTQSYKVVGRQNGTIQISSKFYLFLDNNLGFDGSLFDSDTYDNSGSLELRTILNALRDDILVDDLKPIYLRLFFASLRYVLSEQPYVDWFFKTSFVKATHNLGLLKQKVTYNSDSLDDFEKYISEVKPYRTKIREYVSSYDAFDNSSSMVTDFDLPASFRQDRVEPIYVQLDNQNQLITDGNEINEYPWKHWADAFKFEVSDIKIISQGSGYITKPKVEFIGDCEVPATARAFISNGKVTKVELLTKGSGYTKAPQIIITGGLNESGIAARAVSRIQNNLVRSSLIKIKFDRITKNYFITNLSVKESFIGSGSKLQFNLKWSPDLKTGSTIVKINNQEALKDTYTITTKVDTSRGYTSYYGLLTFNTAPAINDVIDIDYTKDFSHLSAADRINFYYNPQTGELGKDLGQLMQGVDYAGVNVVGLDFKSSSGWDQLPWFSDVWDSFDPTFDDYIVTVADDSTYSFELPYVPANGQEINVYVNGVRIDDPYFDLYDGVTVQPNGRLVAPASVVMKTIIGDGVKKVFELPNLTSNPALDINENDQIIFRKTTSDGSSSPSALDYDTEITGGDMAYSTATGLAADDIIIDGDGFVTPTSSSAPEEVVPGQLVDTVAIKVFDRPTAGSANINSNNYITDGINNVFELSQFINSNDAVLIKVDNQILESSQYTISIKNKTITLSATPANKSIVNVTSFGFNGENILDLDYFVGDGSTIEFITNAPWDQTQSSLVTVSGEVVNYILFRTDNTYDSLNRVGIRFGVPPADGEIVQYLISSSEDRTYSIVSTETITADGSTLVYPLTATIGNKLPFESNVIVRDDNSILRGPDNIYYTLRNNQTTYSIPEYKFVSGNFTNDDFVVYLGGRKLQIMVDYVVDLLTGSITITSSNYTESAVMIISITGSSEYFIENGNIEFVSAPTAGNVITVTSMFNHDVLDIQTTDYEIDMSISLTKDSFEYLSYNLTKGGRIKLNREVIDDSYVWLIKNNTLLTHSIDYKLLSNKREIKLTEKPVSSDVFVVMTYSNNVVKNNLSYMQFKDMLNRDHYKRMSKSRQTFLVKDLKYSDKVIYVDNPDVLSQPNRLKNIPGVIYLNGERIEYFVKDGNQLKQIRRGTLGTGTPEIHVSGLTLIDIGVSETIPYKDDFIIDTNIYDGSSNLLPLQYVPKLVDTSITDSNWIRNNIPNNFGQSNEIEVFVGGYGIKGEWQSKIEYSLGEIVFYGSYTYRCVSDHRSSVFEEDRSNWEYFVGNQRLKKHPYKVHNFELHYESPEGDVEFEADFSVDGTTAGVRLTNSLSVGTKIITIKKVGKIWNDPGTDLVNSNNPIVKFLLSENGAIPITKKSELTLTDTRFDDESLTFDSGDLTFDKG